jgi:nucleoid-associated protein YgaU
MYYGHARHAQFLIDSNPKVGDPKRLAVGTLILLPPLPSDAEAGSTSTPVVRAAAPATKAGSPRTYTVKSGDTFYGIARDVLGDASRWKQLLELNTELVRGDPTRLQVGQVVVLPER